MMFFPAVAMTAKPNHKVYGYDDDQNPVAELKSELKDMATRVVTAAAKTRYLRELMRGG